MSDPETSLGDPDADHSLASLRSVVIGCAMCALIAVAGPYWTIYLMTSRLFADYHGAGVAFLLFVLILVLNVTVGRYWKRAALSKGELLVIAAMMFVSGSIVTSGLLAHFVPALTAPYYDADASNQFATRLWPYLPREKWLFPLDPGGTFVAITKFWDGLGEGEPIPWRPWIRPMVAWSAFIIPLFSAMAAVMSIMRKQWVEYEHLSFPIAQIPAELAEAGANPGNPESIFRSRAFWVGVVIVMLLASGGGIRNYFAVLKHFRLNYDWRFSDSYMLRVRIRIVVVGLAFLISNRLAFSVWSLALVGWFVDSTVKKFNLSGSAPAYYGGSVPEFQHVAMGALLAFCIASIWLSRHHLLAVLRCSFGRGDRDYDKGEPSSYRAALLVLLGGMAISTGWLVWAGMRVLPAATLILSTLVIYYGMARVVAQCGLPSVSSVILPATFVNTCFGATNLGPHQVTLLSAHASMAADVRNTAMAGSAHAVYVARRRAGGLLWLMVAALVITYVVGFVTTIWISYRHGGSNMDNWFFLNSPDNCWVLGTQIVEKSKGPYGMGMLWTGVGGLIMGALIVAQRMFFWWPIHPVGFMVCSSHMVRNLWFSIFLAWLVKLLIVKFAGQQAYSGARRFFIGAVMGYFLAAGIWNIIDTITGHVGSDGGAVFYI